MAVTTRDITASRKSAAKASKRLKASSRPKTSITSKTANWNKAAPGAARKTPSALRHGHNASKVPATPSPRTATPDLIEGTDTETANDHDLRRRLIRRLIRSESAKVRDTQSNRDGANTHQVHKFHSCRRHRRCRRYSSESSTDSEEGDRLTLSFLHHFRVSRPISTNYWYNQTTLCWEIERALSCGRQDLERLFPRR